MLSADLLDGPLEPASINPFELISRQATEKNAINLGQGLPEFGWPPELIEAARAALVEHSNQYPPSAGLPVLREAVAQHYLTHQALRYDASDIVVTSGGTEALAAAIFGLIRPGDEVILIEPFYGAYRPLVERAGGRVRTLRLAPPAFRLDREAIEQCLTDRTRMIVFNNPLNPFGAVLDKGQLDVVADVCCRHDLVAVSDEVWEHSLVAPRQFRSLASIDGMQERTVKIGAAGKIFSLTGWKVGWTCSGPKLTQRIEQAHMDLTFATAPHLQHAVAFGLGMAPGYFDCVRRDLMKAATHLRHGLTSLGLEVLPSEATHFLSIDLRKSGVRCGDLDFCTALLEEAGVATIPISTFYRSDAPTHFVRFCYAKRTETLEAALSRIGAAHTAGRLGVW